MDDIADQQYVANEIAEAISNPTGFGQDVDEDDLMAELEELEQVKVFLALFADFSHLLNFAEILETIGFSNYWLGFLGGTRQAVAGRRSFARGVRADAAIAGRAVDRAAEAREGQEAGGWWFKGVGGLGERLRQCYDYSEYSDGFFLFCMSPHFFPDMNSWFLTTVKSGYSGTSSLFTPRKERQLHY